MFFFLQSLQHSCPWAALPSAFKECYVCQQLFLLQRPRELELSFGLIHVSQSPFNGTFTRCFYKILPFDILVA